MSERKNNADGVVAECIDDLDTQPVLSLSTALDVPADAPVVYLSRDTFDGQPSRVVDVWVGRPQRRTLTRANGKRDYSYVQPTEDGELFTSYLGPHAPDIIERRFTRVPEGGECLVIDNVRVS